MAAIAAAPKTGEERVTLSYSLAELCNDVLDESKTLEEIGESRLFSLANELHQFALEQLKSPTECPELEERNVDRQILDSLLKRIETLVARTFEQLSDYRKTRSTTGWREFCNASDQLKKWVSVIITDPNKNFVNRSHQTLTSEQQRQVDRFQTISILSDTFAHSSNARVDFLRELDSCANVDWKTFDKAFLQRHFDSLGELSQIVLDRKIYQHSSDPGKQEGSKWIEAHRFDDFTAFRTAYLQMAQMIWADKIPEEDKIQFYQCLHTLALGPQDSDPVAWAQSELPYLIPLLGMVRIRLFEANLLGIMQQAWQP